MKRVQVRYPLLHKRSINRQSPFLLHSHAHFYLSTIICFLDESEEGGAAQPLSKEEEVEVMRSWVEVGGFPAQPEEEAQGLLSEASSFLCPPSFLSIDTELFLTVLAFYLDFIFFLSRG